MTETWVTWRTHGWQDWSLDVLAVAKSETFCAADELSFTTVPRLMAGEHLRITQSPPRRAPLEPVLLEACGPLIGCRLVRRL